MSGVVFQNMPSLPVAKTAIPMYWSTANTSGFKIHLSRKGLWYCQQL